MAKSPPTPESPQASEGKNPGEASTGVTRQIQHEAAAAVPEPKREMLRMAKAVQESGLVDDDMIKAAMNRMVDESAISLKL